MDKPLYPTSAPKFPKKPERRKRETITLLHRQDWDGEIDLQTLVDLAPDDVPYDNIEILVGNPFEGEQELEVYYYKEVENINYDIEMLKWTKDFEAYTKALQVYDKKLETYREELKKWQDWKNDKDLQNRKEQYEKLKAEFG